MAVPPRKLTGGRGLRKGPDAKVNQGESYALRAELLALREELKRSPRILACSHEAVSHTGTTSETTLATITLPGGVIGQNGRVRITTTWVVTGNANSKTARIRLGSTAGTAYLATSLPSVTIYRALTEIQALGSFRSQKGGGAYSAGGWGSNVSNTTVTSTYDLSKDTDIFLTGQVANAADTITLSSYLVELIVP